MRERWFNHRDEPENLGRLVFSEAVRIHRATAWRRNLIRENIGLYGSRPRGGRTLVPTAARVGYNALADAVDAKMAEVVRIPARPICTSVGGGWAEWQRTRQLTWALDAEFYRLNVRALSTIGVRDADLAGMGLLYCFRDGDKARIDRIHPESIIFDDSYCVSTPPREYFIIRPMDRQDLVEMYPDKRGYIMDGGSGHGEMMPVRYGNEDNSHMVLVIDAIRLASEDGADDGMIATCISGVCLAKEVYTRDEFPGCFFVGLPPVDGYWGEMPALRAAGGQDEINKTMKKIQDAMHLVSVPRMFVEPQGSGKGLRAQFSNDIGWWTEMKGTPTFMNQQAMHPEVYSYLQQLIKFVFRQIGQNEMGAGAERPPNIRSGSGVRALRRATSLRNSLADASYESAICALARSLVYVHKCIAEDNPSHTVTCNRYGDKMEVKWSDIDLDREFTEIRVYPSSSLPTEPAERIAALEEMLESGTISREDFWLLMDAPDFEGMRDFAVTPLRFLHWTFERILAGDSDADDMVEVAEPECDIDRGIYLCNIYLQLAKMRGAPLERLDSLRRWRDWAMEWQNRATGVANATAEAGGAAAMPPAPPIPGMDDGLGDTVPSPAPNEEMLQ